MLSSRLTCDGQKPQSFTFAHLQQHNEATVASKWHQYLRDSIAIRIPTYHQPMHRPGAILQPAHYGAFDALGLSWQFAPGRHEFT
jgi:hypothetical protein